MDWRLSRRRFLSTTLSGLTVGLTGVARGSRSGSSLLLPEGSTPYPDRAAVAAVRGESRRENIYKALFGIDDQITPRLKDKGYVLIKPNNVSSSRQLASTHADALRGILDYLETRFKGPVVIAESAAGNTWDGFEAFLYTRLPGEYRSLNVSLVDLNEEARFETHQILDGDLHLTPVRLAARLLDPDAFVINAAVMKTHNAVVATLSVKNMVLGAPLHQSPRETRRWSDKRKYHGNLRQTHFAMMQTAQRLAPNWGLTVIDGFEGMEGNGPSSGTPVDSRLALASTDFIAADRIAVEAMGIDAGWPAYLVYCWQQGLGQYDLQKIDIRGESLAEFRKTYRLHENIEDQLLWRGSLDSVPPKIG